MDDLNIDMAKRLPQEWANIYNLKIHSFMQNTLWTEFEWAYNLPNLDYEYISKNYNSEKAEEMELRAFEIKNLIFQTADAAEKSILKDKYIETEFIKNKLLVNI